MLTKLPAYTPFLLYPQQGEEFQLVSWKMGPEGRFTEWREYASFCSPRSWYKVGTCKDFLFPACPRAQTFLPFIQKEHSSRETSHPCLWENPLFSVLTSSRCLAPFEFSFLTPKPFPSPHSEHHKGPMRPSWNILLLA